MREFAADPPEEVRVGDALRDAGHTVAVAESCTGGLIGSLLTDVPGSSDYFDRSLVTYSYDAKRHELAVSREALDEHGAVSEPVAREMAAGVRDVADTTWGVATTGIAGPDGGLPGKPVGTVFVGIAFAAPWGSGDSYTRVERFEYDGSRTQVKEQIARGALRLLVGEVASVANGE
ncbi:CinA family protein [Haloferax mediterranei ATCC 33500]|uniref:CinA C-terminal domain-containing protein n=1 Tax=Haloferax mediterranei (strain ATCC 33500 / DSM 1411 / JCM 8866 / NBRC 14739 / NCIMB 2177 / R-4) TaxID=523841 RepID=I3R2E5_HALMT|nr:CinA family protein [Haloferax mediterranei]AFK18405.1 CinA C-terminal domain-containing protein [Haloferax mediterranei ATCC 33500]AHZ22201.1 damage-inducible protein CinA [Haloferax mediterranei ATCC 33500]EMA02320.1 CinA C-terminal domain-containing protein [Haloferax mediterranei ATCC 33500]MDX5988497.1 CinA family protein [Haloferax mediterranei ATCC 33500]QCQ74914.1 CinA family protein [Haloferax mediterranei ATCC 33500]